MGYQLSLTYYSHLTSTGDSEGAHRQVYSGQEHEAKFSHELLAGAASFEAMKLFEDHHRKEGKPPLLLIYSFLSFCPR